MFWKWTWTGRFWFLVASFDYIPNVSYILKSSVELDLDRAWNRGSHLPHDWLSYASSSPAIKNTKHCLTSATSGYFNTNAFICAIWPGADDASTSLNLQEERILNRHDFDTSKSCVWAAGWNQVWSVRSSLSWFESRSRRKISSVKKIQNKQRLWRSYSSNFLKYPLLLQVMQLIILISLNIGMRSSWRTEQTPICTLHTPLPCVSLCLYLTRYGEFLQSTTREKESAIWCGKSLIQEHSTQILRFFVTLKITERICVSVAVGTN